MRDLTVFPLSSSPSIIVPLSVFFRSSLRCLSPDNSFLRTPRRRSRPRMEFQGSCRSGGCLLSGVFCEPRGDFLRLASFSLKIFPPSLPRCGNLPLSRVSSLFFLSCREISPSSGPPPPTSSDFGPSSDLPSFQ